ncbi:MAG: peptidyl-prolyl cis-trans isomerase [Pseudomonadota bacterium]
MSGRLFSFPSFSIWVALSAILGCSICLCGVATADEVLARIGNETVTDADLKEMANAVPEKFRHLYLTPAGRRQTLEYIVNVYALAAAAEKEGLEKSPKFQKLAKFAKKDLLARMYLEENSKTIPEPTEAEAKAFFEQNAEQMRTPEEVHLRHILVKTEKEAKDVLNKLKKGEDFGKIAAKESLCPSKTRGGDLDWMPRGRLVTEIETVAFSMNKGDVTGPIKTKHGFHVLLLEDKRPARQSSFEEVKDYVMEQLQYTKKQERYESLARDLKTKLNVQVEASKAPEGGATEPAAPAPKAPGTKN